MCIHMCICICMYICTCLCIWICVCTYVCIYAHIYISYKCNIDTVYITNHTSKRGTKKLLFALACALAFAGTVGSDAWSPHATRRTRFCKIPSRQCVHAHMLGRWLVRFFTSRPRDIAASSWGASSSGEAGRVSPPRSPTSLRSMKTVFEGAKSMGKSMSRKVFRV